MKIGHEIHILGSAVISPVSIFSRIIFTKKLTKFAGKACADSCDDTAQEWGRAERDRTGQLVSHLPLHSPAKGAKEWLDAAADTEYNALK